MQTIYSATEEEKDQAWRNDDAKYVEFLNNDIDQKNSYKRTSLHLAVSYGNYNIVKALIEKHAKINSKDDIDWTPLHYAVGTHSTEKGFKELQFKMAKLLVENGSDVNAKGGLDVHTNRNMKQTPLHLAAEQGNFEVVKLLVEI